MAKTAKSKKPAAKTATSPADEGMTKVIGKVTDKDPQPNWEAFCEYVADLGGPDIDPRHVGIVLTGYRYFQKSDKAEEYRAEQEAARESAKAEKASAREEQATERKASKKAKAKESVEATTTPAKKAGKKKAARKAAF